MRTLTRPADEISHLGPREVRPYKMPSGGFSDLVRNLPRFGVTLDSRTVEAMYAEYKSGSTFMLDHQARAIGMDAALVPAQTVPSITTPLQFLQEWLAGFVFNITFARKIDDLVGITTQGRWEDEEIVQGILERSGKTAVYGDVTNIPLSSWNVNFESRTIIRAEEGMSVGRLEEARASRIRVSSAESKRSAAAEALEIFRNEVGFVGYNDGQNRTFGFLNDPDLPAYTTFPNGVGGSPLWSTKTYLEILGDIQAAFSELRIKGKGRIDPGKEPVTMALPIAAYDFLGTVSQFGNNSVMEWLKGTYPNTKIEAIPELDTGNAGASAFYLYAEGVNDESTDDRRTFVQVVPSKFYSVGVEQRAKGYTEVYSNATAGILLKRPYAVVRFTGL